MDWPLKDGVYMDDRYNLYYPPGITSTTPQLLPLLPPGTTSTTPQVLPLLPARYYLYYHPGSTSIPADLDEVIIYIYCYVGASHLDGIPADLDEVISQHWKQFPPQVHNLLIFIYIKL